MTSQADISGWAGLILENLGETGIPTGQVAVWLNTNLGNLNSALETEYLISGTGNVIAPDMGAMESGVYTEMYICDYFRKKANQFLGAMSYDANAWIEIEGVDQGRIRRVNKNEVAKQFRQLYLDCCSRLDKLIDWYKDQRGAIQAKQILYNTRVDVSNGGLRNLNDFFPPSSYYSSYNFIWNI